MVLQPHIHPMYLFTAVATLQPPRLSNDHLLQFFSELISSLPFLWILPITNPSDIFLHERHKQLLAVGEIECTKAAAALCAD